jgi:hypothetical protein
VVRPKAVSTPLWVRAIVVALLVGAPVWGLVTHLDRMGNQRRLGAIASEIAGRPVKVHCPGAISRRLLSYDIVEGTVRFDAQGRPADHTDLRPRTCAELDAMAEGRRDDVLACVAAAAAACGVAADDLAWAVDTLTHESFHLAGIIDEADTECHAMKAMAGTAVRLGATPQEAAALARHHVAVNYPREPERYRTPLCDVTEQ